MSGLSCVKDPGIQACMYQLLDVIFPCEGAVSWRTVLGDGLRLVSSKYSPQLGHTFVLRQGFWAV